jgi:hypothetical protein
MIWRKKKKRDKSTPFDVLVLLRLLNLVTRLFGKYSSSCRDSILVGHVY